MLPTTQESHQMANRFYSRKCKFQNNGKIIHSCECSTSISLECLGSQLSSKRFYTSEWKAVGKAQNNSGTSLDPELHLSLVSTASFLEKLNRLPDPEKLDGSAEVQMSQERYGPRGQETVECRVDECEGLEIHINLYLTVCIRRNYR